MLDHKAISDAAMDIARTTHDELSTLLRAAKAAHGGGAFTAEETAAMVATSQRQSAAATLAHLFSRDDGRAQTRIAALQAIAAGQPVREGILSALVRAVLIHGDWLAKPHLTNHGAAVLALYNELTAATPHSTTGA